jgi:hypothetical protein
VSLPSLGFVMRSGRYPSAGDGQMARDFAGDAFGVLRPALNALALRRRLIVAHQFFERCEEGGNGNVARCRVDWRTSFRHLPLVTGPALVGSLRGDEQRSGALRGQPGRCQYGSHVRRTAGVFRSGFSGCRWRPAATPRCGSIAPLTAIRDLDGLRPLDYVSTLNSIHTCRIIN